MSCTLVPVPAVQTADPLFRHSQALGAVLAALVILWYAPESALVQRRRAALVSDSMPQPASPAALPATSRPTRGTQVRLAFIGDIMQHRAQARDDFRSSYAQVAPRLRAADLAIGNLEFPVDSTLPVGPDPGTVRFNGSPAHLDALAAAGIDVLQTANNHCFDRGLVGLTRTLEAVEGRGMLAVGTARSVEALRAAPLLVNVRNLPIAFRAYTIPPNAYLDEEGRAGWPPRDLPVFALDFDHWLGEDRAQGRALFQEHVDQARAAGAAFVVALVHWGKEYHLRPTADQRSAAHDLVDAGFDLVVGTHSHVLNPPEIYQGKVIAYSLGNFMGRGLRLETRIGAVLEVVVTTGGRDPRAAVTDFRYLPTLLEPRGHLAVPLDFAIGEEAGAARQFVSQVLGPAAAGWR